MKDTLKAVIVKECQTKNIKTMHCINAILFPPSETPDRPFVTLPFDWKIALPGDKDKLKNAIIIETDYFGGPGEQHATVIQNGIVIQETLWKTDNWHPINNALAYFGLQKNANMDEFDTINLGHYRSNEDIQSELLPKIEPQPETDSDTLDYEFAKEVFELEEGRPANMNNDDDMRMVAALQTGIRHQRLRNNFF